MNNNTTTPKQLYTEKEAAKWLGICPRTLWAIRASGKIPYVRFDRGIRYDLDDLRAFVARNKKVEVSNG